MSEMEQQENKVMVQCKPNAHQRIRAAMQRNESDVLRLITDRGVWKPIWPLESLARMKATQRLGDQGKIHYDRRRGGYVLTGKRR